MRTRTMTSLDLGSSLGFLVNQVAKKMTAQFNSLLAEHGLTTSQWAVLACLWRADGLPQNEISRRSGIDAATLTEMLKRMTERGLIRRERDPENNRYQRVYLTSRDTKLRDKITEQADAVNQRAMAGFSAADRARLTKLLQRALTNLDTAPEDLA